MNAKKEGDRKISIRPSIRKKYLDKLDEKVKEIKADNPFVQVDRGTVIEGLIKEFIEEEN